MSILLLLAPAIVAATPPAAAPQPPSKADKIVCTRRPAASLGTNIVKPRVCKKKSEWDAEAATARRNLRKFQDHRSDPAPVRNSQPIPL